MTYFQVVGISFFVFVSFVAPAILVAPSFKTLAVRSVLIGTLWLVASSGAAGGYASDVTSFGRYAFSEAVYGHSEFRTVSIKTKMIFRSEPAALKGIDWNL